MSHNPPNPYASPAASDAPGVDPSNFYRNVPFWRREGVCSALLSLQLLGLILLSFGPAAFPFTAATMLGALIVCVVTLTGPVYRNHLSSDGTLAQWGTPNRVAAALLLLPYGFGAGVLIYDWFVNQ